MLISLCDNLQSAGNEELVQLHYASQFDARPHFTCFVEGYQEGVAEVMNKKDHQEPAVGATEAAGGESTRPSASEQPREEKMPLQKLGWFVLIGPCILYSLDPVI